MTADSNADKAGEPLGLAAERPVRPVSEARKTMRLHRIEYVEIPSPDTQHPEEGVCHYCALNLTDACRDAVIWAAEAAFGGDCDARDVVYERA